MPKIVDWSGQKFFYITMIKKLSIKNNRGGWLWEGLCDCGTTIHIDPNHAKRGSIKHCGCKRTTTAKDWTSQTFNSLTFIKAAGRTTGSKIRWEVICSCGRTTIVVPYEVVSGKTKTCGLCPRPSQSKNWTNIKHGSLTFISRHKTYADGKMCWKAQCDCGVIIYTIPSANAKSCGCIGKEFSKIWCSTLGKLGRKYHPNESVARKVWQRYKEHNIDYDSFYKMSQSLCNYCGIQPNTTYQVNGGTFTYNGLDRTDSSKGHTLDNVVTCCWECNESKRDKTLQQFLSHVERINNHQIKINGS
jgi:hypothetical protein